MCGRDTFFATWAQVREFSMPLPVATPDEPAGESYNRAPSQPGWVIVPDDAGGTVVSMRWGLIPFWAKDRKIAYSTINARLESASSKPAFREPWKKRRCIVPSSGYYEWQIGADGKSKQPWFIHSADGPLLLFAGLWDRWRERSVTEGESESEVDSYSIITRSASGPIEQVHDRMPLILPPDSLADWLHASPDDAEDFANNLPPPDLCFHKVGRAVGNVRNQGESLINALDDGSDAA